MRVSSGSIWTVRSNLLRLVLLFLFLVAPAFGQGVPTVIDLCITLWQPTVCFAAVKEGQKFVSVPQGFGNYAIERFDSNGVVLKSIPSSDAEGLITLTGKPVGNRIKGALTFSAGSAPQLQSHSTWSASLHYPPNGDPAKGRNLYVGCVGEVDIVNTADHVVRIVKLPAGTRPSAIAVSAEGYTAYLAASTMDQHAYGIIYVIDGRAGVVTRTLNLGHTAILHGVWSLVTSPDDSTLYGVGNSLQSQYSIGVVDATTGRVKSVVPLKTTDSPGIVLSGSKIFSSDGSFANITDDGQARTGVGVFTSNGFGLAAFPDGKRICSDNHIIDTISKSSLPALCSAIVPTGMRTYGPGQALVDENGTPETNKGFGKGLVLLPKSTAGLVITPDGTTLFAAETDGPRVYAYSTAVSVMTDAIRVCDKPVMLGIQPLARLDR